MIRKWWDRANRPLESIENRDKMREKRAGTEESTGGAARRFRSRAQSEVQCAWNKGTSVKWMLMSVGRAALTSGQKHRPGLRRNEANIPVECVCACVRVCVCVSSSYTHPSGATAVRESVSSNQLSLGRCVEKE